MPISEALQQAYLNASLSALFGAAGNSFTMLLYLGATELSGNGYARQTITTIPDASAVNDDGLCTVSLETDDPFTAVDGDIEWTHVEIRDSSGDEVVFPRVYSYGLITDGESRNVTAVFGLPKSRYATTQAEIQARLDSDKESGEPVEIAGGDIVLTSAINYTNTVGATKIGSELLGRGRGEPYVLGHPNRGNYTNLVVPGSKSAEQAAILYKQAFAKLKGMTIAGRYSNVSADKLPIGIDMRWVSGGVGKLSAEDLFLYWCEIGIRLAKDANELNCDESTWKTINFSNCDICVQMNSVQTMGHKFEDIYVGSSPVVFDIHGGGNIHVDGILIQDSETDILHFRADTPSQFGPNNAGWKIEFLKMDSQAVGSRLLVQDLSNGYYNKVIFDQPQFPFIEWTQPALLLSGRSNTTISNASFFQADMLTWQSNWAKVVPVFNLKDTTIWPWDSEINDMDPSDTPLLFNRILDQSTGDCDINVENVSIYKNDGGEIIQVPLDDWSGRLTGTA